MVEALRYNEGKPKWSLLDFKSLEGLVRVMEYGEHKYSTYKLPGSDTIIKGSNIPISQKDDYELVTSGKDNWKGFGTLDELLNSSQRHWVAINNGEILDSESGLPHSDHILANMMMYNYRSNNFKEEL